MMEIDAGCGINITNKTHSLAALALYQQPFGFTREELEVLAELASRFSDESAVLGQVAAKIRALLPPEE